MRLKIRKDWAEIAYINKKESAYYSKAIERVRELHKKIPARDSSNKFTCKECYAFYTHYEYEYPCPTIQVLDNEEWL